MIVGMVELRGITVKFWDVSGNEKLHSLWQNYYSESDGIIFVIDGNDWERIEKVKACFANLTGDEELEGTVPVLILVNKQDLQENVDLAAKIKETFNPIMANISARECKVLSCSALKGTGIDEAISWIINKMLM